MRNKIIAAEGSIQSIAEIPTEIKTLYKTVWEIRRRL
jgi:ribonucleoside-diphosphate reductase alpha chain